MNPSYYGIMTASIRYSKELNDFQKVLYTDITALSNRYGYCTASNAYFADLFDKSTSTISRSVSALQRAGHLTVKLVYKKGTKEVIGRRIYPEIKVDDGNPLDVKHDFKTEKIKKVAEKKEQKEIMLPEWLDKDIWEKWVLHRKEKRQTLTPSTIKMQIEMLSKNRMVYKEIIMESIRSGWTGLFPLKQGVSNKEPEEGSIGWQAGQDDNPSIIDVEADMLWLTS